MSDVFTGFGMVENGKVVHVVVYGDRALCDKRQKGLLVNKKLKTSDVTCKKCQQYALYKELPAKPKVPDTAPIPPEEEQKDHGVPTMPAKAKAKTTTSKKGATTTTTTAKEKRAEKKATKDDVVIEDEGDFYAKETAKDRYKIYHRPTGKVFFDSIPEIVVMDTIINLNEIEERWANVDSPLPDGFITKCRSCLIAAYKTHKLTLPKSLNDKKQEKKKKKAEPKRKTRKFKKGETLLMEVNGEEVLMEFDGDNWKKASPEAVQKAVQTTEKPEKPKKKARVITRRRKRKDPERAAEEIATKADKRKIKRRAKKKAEEKPRQIKRRAKTNTLYGRREGSPAYTLVKSMCDAKDGVTFKELSNILKKEHNITGTKARSRIKGAIRNLTRKVGVPVIIVQRKKIEDDTYKVVLPEEDK